MPALNFQARFAHLVKSGNKTQTIRKYRRDGRDPVPGDTLFLYTGMRQKKCRLLGKAYCHKVQEIAINESGIRIGAHYVLTRHEHDLLAKDDGFENWPEMRDWFVTMHGLPFHGFLIEWDLIK